MTDSVESKSEKLHNEILSRLADDDYLLSKIIAMRQNRKLSKDDINYIIKNAEEKVAKENSSDIDNFVNNAVSKIIQECESSITKEVSSKSSENELEFTEKILQTNLSLDNYEEVFGLKGLKAVELPFSSDEEVQSIRYKDNEGITLAIAQINKDINKIRLQTFGGVLPKQEFINPQQVNYRVMSKSKTNGWSAEYGGINQFDGSIEIRYKDADGKVMAAVIFKSDGNVDTVVEYQYHNDKKTQMLHTSQHGHSKTIYDDETDTTKMIVDIDTDGNICCVTRGFDK